MLALLHLENLELASLTLHQGEITLSDVTLQFLSWDSCITAFVRAEIRREGAGGLVFVNAGQVMNFLASKLFILTFDPQSLLYSILHKLVHLKELWVWHISPAFVWTLFSIFDA